MQSEITLQAELTSRLKARLASESAKNEGLQLEVLALQPQLVQPNQLDASSEQERTENAAALEKLQKYVLELEGQRTALTAQKEEWEITHKKLLSDLETETHRKVDAEKDRDFFKEQYAKASGFVGQVRDENKDLEKKATIAQEQATTGVAGVRMLFEARVKMLEEDLKAWRRTAEFMIQKDIRTNDDIRKRAAETPELHARCARQEVALEEMQERQDELEEEVKEKKEAFEVAEREVEHWKSQAARLNIELSEAKTKLETIARAAGSGSVNESFSQSQDMGDGDSGGGSEMVYCCQWRTSDGNGNTTACKEAFSTISELEQHLFTGGHLQPS
ncbi:hypothetical protein CPB84DRAFT_1019628 [Gymnopilus junonius]|uniref:Uncharacterized protein n=1 Tax=Gymnopilus junonius TaxID=109634 RepID=A0A9P5NMX7_GYMJU|nr:hypothetical protein CPB84DRAFT_1019628 [Gymnopilus junonius]